MANEWTINYLPADGGRLTGKLKVGDDEVRFTTLYDSSNKEIIKGIAGSLGAFAASGGHVAYIHDTDTEFEVVLPRAEDRVCGGDEEGHDEACAHYDERRERVPFRLRHALDEETRRRPQFLTGWRRPVPKDLSAPQSVFCDGGGAALKVAGLCSRARSGNGVGRDRQKDRDNRDSHHRDEVRPATTDERASWSDLRSFRVATVHAVSPDRT